MADIFISYSKQEAELTVALARDLEERGYTTWWDTSLLPGEEFGERIRTELARARVVIVIWTASSVSSRWVQAEAQLAEEQSKLIAVRTPDLHPSSIPLPFNTRHTDLITERQKIFRAVTQYNLLAPFDHDDDVAAAGHGIGAGTATQRLGRAGSGLGMGGKRRMSDASSTFVATMRRVTSWPFAIDKIYLALGIVILGLGLGAMQLLDVSRSLNQGFVSLLQPHPDGVLLEGRYLYPNYLFAFSIIVLAAFLIAFSTLCAGYLRRGRPRAPSRELVSLRQDVSNIIRYSSNITNYIYGGYKEAGRFDIIDAHVRYRIRPNGDTEVRAVFEIHCTTDPGHFWKYWIDADAESEGVTSFRQLNFEVIDLETMQKLDWLPTFSDSRRKEFAIFFSEVRPGERKKFRISFFWPGYMRKLTDLGATSFDWKYWSQHAEQRARFRQEWIFDPDLMSVRCRLTGRQSKTATLQQLRQENRSTWIYEDPLAMMDRTQFSVEFSTGSFD
jgi:hypothetical protein